MAHEQKRIEATATKGPSLSLCSHCKKVVGETVVVLSMPFYADLGNDTVPLSSLPEMLHIEFAPVERCVCNVLKTRREGTGTCGLPSQLLA